MRAEWWEVPSDENSREVEQILDDRDRWAVFAAILESTCTGFLEAHLREYAEGAAASPVGYQEGLFVQPEFRRRGFARLLIEAGEAWARSRGCTEMASDAHLDNAASIRLHSKLGYHEVDRVVCFLKRI